MNFFTHFGRRPAKHGDMDSSDDEDVSASAAEVGDKYMQETTLHGLKYITETRRHSLERLFWFVIIVIAWTCGAYMIYMVMNKWKTSPVLVSFDSVQTGIYNIPFPSMTVCNMNKVRKSRVEHIDDELVIDPGMRKICSTNTSNLCY